MNANTSGTSRTQESTLRVIQGAAKPYVKRLIRWICPEKRVANRYAAPPLVAYLGSARSSTEYKIGNFSVGGFYMVTEERWMPGTSFPVTLERVDPEGIGRTLTVSATVVRTGENGVGFSFVPPPKEDWTENSGATLVDLTRLAEFLNGLRLAETDAEPLRRAS